MYNFAQTLVHKLIFSFSLISIKILILLLRVVEQQNWKKKSNFLNVTCPQKAAQSLTTSPAPTTSEPLLTVPATRGTCRSEESSSKSAVVVRGWTRPPWKNSQNRQIRTDKSEQTNQNSQIKRHFQKLNEYLTFVFQKKSF